MRACVRYAYRGGARGVPGPSVVRWTRSRAWEVRTGIDKHNGLVKFHSTILLFACARVGPSGSNMLPYGILAPPALAVRQTKTVECNINLFSVFCGAFIGFLCHTETKAINKWVAEEVYDYEGYK